MKLKLYIDDVGHGKSIDYSPHSEKTPATIR